MKILFAASEVAPFAMTGGLADVAGSLPLALAALGHDVRIVLPRYRQVDRSALGLTHAATFYVPLASWKERCDILTGKLGKNVTVYFINKDIYFDRPGLYGTPKGDYPDNAERFIFFSRAVPELCRVLNFKPDIIHCNDWQTGLVPLYVRTLAADVEELRTTRTVFTVHNLGYQGVFWHWDMRLTGLSWDVFTPEGIEFWGKMNLLKAGLVYADVISTVSATYSREIQTPEYGHGLDGVLRKRSLDLYGIVNGINYDEWDPAKDPALPKTYSAARPSGKQACKEALRKLLKLPRVAAPLLGMVTRLSDQKGLDILMDALPRILARNCQLIILGTGDERYHRLLTERERPPPGPDARPAQIRRRPRPKDLRRLGPVPHAIAVRALRPGPDARPSLRNGPRCAEDGRSRRHGGQLQPPDRKRHGLSFRRIFTGGARRLCGTGPDGIQPSRRLEAHRPCRYAGRLFVDKVREGL